MTNPQIASAKSLIARSDVGPAGVWPRAAAFLIRQALEDALDELWATNLPGMERASRASQLACLAYASPDRRLADNVRIAWSALSRACHHHSYELAPTAPELENWLLQTEGLISALEAAEFARS